MVPTGHRTPRVGFASATTPLASTAEAGAPSPAYGRVGRFAVLDVLGHGGMGTVLDAYDEALDRKVALKVLHPDIAERYAQRLVREAQALAKLSHPNVVQVYEVGTVDQRTFIAMERIRGQTLQRWQTERRRPWRECVRLYLQAGRGLMAAHAVGLVHRDFKPGNCIVDREGRVRVLDFGLVRELESGSEDRGVDTSWRPEPRVDAFGTKLTRTGVVVGTFVYMPLEQLDGHPATPLSDQFSFCVSLYEAVYGQRPFPCRTVGELATSLRLGRVNDPPRGSRAPRRLRRLLVRGLDRSPRRRWPSMEALLRELESIARPRRTGLLTIGLVTVTAAIATPVLLRSEPSAPSYVPSQDIIDTHVQAARAAAARALYLYPPPEESEARTAYVEVVTLETLADTLGPAATEAASSLRAEFSETLMRLGDRYWAHPQTRSVAVDHYTAALAFDPTLARAWDRAAITPSALNDLQYKAERLDFEASELAANAPVPAQAQAQAEPTPIEPTPATPIDAVKPSAPRAARPASAPDPVPTPAPSSGRPSSPAQPRDSGHKVLKAFEKNASRASLKSNTWAKFRASMKAQQSVVEACGRRHAAPNDVSIGVIVKLSGDSGRVIGVTPTKTHANTPLGLCVANVVSHNVQVGEFDAPSFTYSYIYHL